MPLIQFSGIASGIDSASLIDALINAREQQNVPRREEIADLEASNSALDRINTDILALNDLVDGFRTLDGGGLQQRATSSDPSVATAVVGSSAVNGAVSLNVQALATNATASFDDTYTATTDAIAPNAVGTQTVEVQVGTGADQVSVSVDITSATTVEDFVNSFNSATNAAGNVVAAAVNVGTESSPSYRVVFTGQHQGTDKGTIAFNIPSGAAGFGGNNDLQNRTISQASNAEFTVSGINSSTVIERSSNTISDVLSGVTLQLESVGTTTITVSPDADATADGIQEIVDSFNNIAEFINDNNLISQDETSEDGDLVFGSLSKTSIDDDFINAFRSDLSTATSANGTLVKSFAQLGVSTNRDGTLAFDRDEFLTAVGNDPTGAAEVITSFADAAAGAAGTFSEFTKFEGLIDNTQNSNNNQIENINEKIESVERFSESLRENLTQTFARLEATIGGLQSQQNALTSILSSL